MNTGQTAMEIAQVYVSDVQAAASVDALHATDAQETVRLHVEMAV